MTVIAQWIVSIIIAVASGGAASYWLIRSQNAKTQAETSRIYQQMALGETAERERLQERFERRIAELCADRTALEERLVALRTELDALKREKETWESERILMEMKIQEQKTQIEQLRERIKVVEKKQTGQL